MGVSDSQPLSRRYLEDEKWINDHYGELRRRYPDQWIAVLKGEVVAAGKDLGLVQTEGRRRARQPTKISPSIPSLKLESASTGRIDLFYRTTIDFEVPTNTSGAYP